MTVVPEGRGGTTVAGSTTTPPTARHVVRRLLGIAVGIAIVVVDVRLIEPYAAGAATALRHPVFRWLALGVAAELTSMWAAGHLQQRMLRAGGTRIPAPKMIRLTYAANAVSMSLPAGAAMSARYMFRRLRQLGASVPTTLFTLLSSGLLSSVAYSLVAVLGLALAGGASGSPFALVGLTIVCGGLIFGARSLLRHLDLIDRVVVWALHAVNRLRRRPPDSGVSSILESTSVLRTIDPRGRDWAAGLSFALVNWIGDLVCLLASCQAVGAHRATISVVLLAYLAGTSVSSISLVPGGLGVVDAALIVVLVHGGVGTAVATSGVVLYRVVSFGFVVLAGWVAWATYWLAAHRSDHGRFFPQPHPWRTP